MWIRPSYHLAGASPLALDVGYLLTVAPVPTVLLGLLWPWTWIISTPPVQRSTAATPDLECGVFSSWPLDAPARAGVYYKLWVYCQHIWIQCIIFTKLSDRTSVHLNTFWKYLPNSIPYLTDSYSLFPSSYLTKDKVHAKSFQSCQTLRYPMDCSPPGSPLHGILQARILEWFVVPFSRGCSQSRDQTHVSYVYLHWQAGSLPLAPPGNLF